MQYEDFIGFKRRHHEQSFSEKHRKLNSALKQTRDETGAVFRQEEMDNQEIQEQIDVDEHKYCSYCEDSRLLPQQP